MAEAGVIEDGEWSQTLEGTPQGASVSSCSRTFTSITCSTCGSTSGVRHARGDVVVARFADDFVVGFEHRGEAERFWAELRERFASFGLELHEGKTRLIEFGASPPNIEPSAATPSLRRSISWALRTSV